MTRRERILKCQLVKLLRYGTEKDYLTISYLIPFLKRNGCLPQVLTKIHCLPNTRIRDFLLFSFNWHTTPHNGVKITDKVLDYICSNGIDSSDTNFNFYSNLNLKWCDLCYDKGFERDMTSNFNVKQNSITTFLKRYVER